MARFEVPLTEPDYTQIELRALAMMIEDDEITEPRPQQSFEEWARENGFA